MSNLKNWFQLVSYQELIGFLSRNIFCISFLNGQCGKKSYFYFRNFTLWLFRILFLKTKTIGCLSVPVSCQSSPPPISCVGCTALPWFPSVFLCSQVGLGLAAPRPAPSVLAASSPCFFRPVWTWATSLSSVLSFVLAAGLRRGARAYCVGTFGGCSRLCICLAVLGFRQCVTAAIPASGTRAEDRAP